MIACNGNHSCPECKPNEHPPHIRQSPEHVGLRFDDTTKADALWRVFLNGEGVSEQAYEALPGEVGFVRLFPYNDQGKKHLCSCKKDVCTWLVYGRVEVLPVT